MDVLSSIVSAVSALHSPHSSHADREDANGSLREFAENHPEAINYALEILGQGHSGGGGAVTTTAPSSLPYDDATRHFALHIIDRCVKRRWSGLPREAQERVRSALVALLRHGTRGGSDDPTQEAGFVKEKICALVGEMVKREYPQNWPNFFIDLVTTWSMGMKQAELCILVLEGLAEDCQDSDFNTSLPASRRNDILRGINTALPDLLPLVYQQLGADYTALKQGQQVEARRLMLRRTLSMLQRFLYGVARALVASPSHNFLEVFLVFLSEPDEEADLRTAATLCLRGLVRGGSGAQGAVLLPSRGFQEGSPLPADCALAYLFDHLPQAVTRLLAAQQAGEQPEYSLTNELPFHTTLVDMLSALLLNNLKLVCVREAGEAAKVAPLMGVLIDLLQHPSLRMAHAQLGLWMAVVRDDRLCGSALFARFAEPLLERYALKCISCAEAWQETISWAGAAVDECLVEEFDDADEYQELLSSVRGQVGLLARHLAARFPVVAARFCQSRLTAALLMEPVVQETSMGALPSRELSVRAQLAQIEPLYSILDNVTSGIAYDKNYDAGGGGSSPEVAAHIETMLGTVLAWGTVVPRLLYQRLILLSCFKRHLGVRVDRLPAVLEALFTAVSYRGDPGDATTPAPDAPLAANVGRGHPGAAVLSAEVKHVRRRACSSLISIARAIPLSLLPLLDQLSRTVIDLLQSGRLVLTEQTFMYEMLVLVSNRLPTVQARSEFIGKVLGEPLGVWQSCAVTELLASPESVLRAMFVSTDPAQTGAAENAGGEPGDALSRLALHHSVPFLKMLQSLESMMHVARRVLSSAPAGGNGMGDGGGQVWRATTPVASMDEAAACNAFVPYWTAMMPNLLALVRCLHGIWSEPLRSQLLSHPRSTWVLALTGEDLKRYHLVTGQNPPPGRIDCGGQLDEGDPARHWGEWLSKARDVAYQALGLACQHRALYFLGGARGERLAEVLCGEGGPLNPAGYAFMEHRHMSSLLKYFAVPLVLNCPEQLLETGLGWPCSGLISHQLQRLTVCWQARGELQGPQEQQERERRRQQQGGSIMVGMPQETVEVIQDKLLSSVTRATTELLQILFVLRGALAVPSGLDPWDPMAPKKPVGAAAKRAKAKQRKVAAAAANAALADAESMGLGSAVTGATDLQERSVEGDAAREERSQAVLRFALGCEHVAGPTALCVIGLMTYPESFACRRAIMLGVRLLELVCDNIVLIEQQQQQQNGNGSVAIAGAGVGTSRPVLASREALGRFLPVLARDMFAAAVRALVTEPQYMMGLQWDMLGLVRDIYIKLQLSQLTLPIMQAQHAAVSGSTATTGGAPTASFAPLSGEPRAVLASLGGVTPAALDSLDTQLRLTMETRARGHLIRDFLQEVVARGASPHPEAGTAGGESVLREKRHVIDNLPQQLLLTSTRLVRSCSNGMGSGAGGNNFLDNEGTAGLCALFQGDER